VKLEYEPSEYNIYLQGKNKIVIWNTVTDKLMSVNKGTELYNCYYNTNKMGKSKEYLLNGSIGSEESIHMLCGLLNIKSAKSEEYSEYIKEEYTKKTEDTLEVVVTTTFGCNFGCAYCCQGTSKDFTVFDENLVDNITYILSNSNLKKLHVTWYGGEPLLHGKKIIKASGKLKQYCKEQNYSYTSDLLTNGYLLTTKICKELTDADINFFQISLDGSKKNHDNSRYLKSGLPTFDAIMANIESIEKNDDIKAKISVRININSCENDAIDIINDLMEYKANTWKKTKFYLSPIEIRLGTDDSENTNAQTPQKFSKLFNDFIQIGKKKGIPLFIPGFYKGSCTATKENSMVIDPKGNIFKCWDEVIKENLKVATIDSKPDTILEQIKNSNWSTFKASNTSLCSTCKLLPACGGNCAIKHKETVEYEGFHSACPPIKLILKEYILDRAISKGVLEHSEESIFQYSAVSLESLQMASRK